MALDSMTSSSQAQAGAALRVGEVLRSCDAFILFDVFIFLLVVGLTTAAHVTSLGPYRFPIVLDQRIGPVYYGEPQRQITGTLGRGLPVAFGGLSFRSYLFGIYVAYPPIWLRDSPGQPSLSPQLEASTAAIVMTRSPEYKTPSGVGVGTPLRQLRQRIPVACSIAARTRNVTRCQTANATASTVFAVDPRTHRVTQVEIGPPDW